MKRLVVYYSLEGNTALVATYLADCLTADRVELKPEKPFTPSGFSRYFLGGMMALFGRKPALKPSPYRPEDYEEIYVGTPVWAGHCTPFVRSWLDSAGLSGRRVVLFATGKGGDPQKAILDMEKLLPDCRIADRLYFVSPKETPEETLRRIESLIEK